MKTIDEFGAQGDVALRRVSALPRGAVAATGPDALVVAHSETGHHHEAVGDATRYTVPGNVLLSYLVTRGPVTIEHRRPWDTHETLLLDSGDAPEVVWEIRRQREHTPEGWRVVAD